MRTILATAAILTAQTLSAATPIDGIYATVFGGFADVPNNISNSNFGLVRNAATYSRGYNAGGSVGFKAHPLRYEGELTYLNANLNSFNINNRKQIGVRGYTDAYFAMANVYYDIPSLVEPLQPYLGIGLGYSWVNAKMSSTAPIRRTQYTGSNSLFAYQALAGIAFNFAENYSLGIGYRYVATERSHILGKIYQANLFNLEATYRFDGNTYK